MSCAMEAFVIVIGIVVAVALVRWFISMAAGASFVLEACAYVRANGVEIDEHDPDVVKLCVLAKRQGYTPRQTSVGLREMVSPTRLSDDIRDLITPLWALPLGKRDKPESDHTDLVERARQAMREAHRARGRNGGL